MNFDDTAEEAIFRKKARAWIAANAPGELPERTVSGEDWVQASKDWMARKAAAGWACLAWPENYGGRGAKPMEVLIWNQEEEPYAVLNGVFVVGQGMCGPILMAYGTDEQKKRYLPPMARGEEIWCQMFSEPASGSDLAGLRTKAVRDGDDWIVNGQKIWTSAAQYSNYGILLVRSDPWVPKHKGLTFFFVDMSSPGIEIRPIRQVSGESHFNEVFFTDVRVPDSQRLGDVGDGWKVAVATLMNERLAVGTAFPTNFDDVFELAREVEGDDGPAIKDRAVRASLADWYVKSSGLKYTGMRMASALSQGKAPGPEGSIIKLVLGRGRQEIAAAALDILDMAGSVTDPAFAWRNAVLHKVFFRSIGNRLEGGSDEIMRNIVAERVLGMPAEIRVDKDVPFNEIPRGTE